MDAKTLHILEFDKVLARLVEYTSFSAGAALARALRPTADEQEARYRQALTREAIALLQGDDTATIGSAHDVRLAADNALRGFVLLPEELMRIRDTLIAARTLKRTLLRNPERHPRLSGLGELIEEIPGLITAVNTALDDRGELLDSASPRLGQLRQELRAAHNRIQDRLRLLISGSMSQYLQEPIITLRAGRYVVPLRAEHKGRIKGIVHDQSASGATLWIEPLHTVDLNNQYRSLQIEEEREIQRILAELSGRVAQHGEALKRIVDRMAELDLSFACARYAMVTDAVEPIFAPWRSAVHPHPGSAIWMRAARHPLLDPAVVIPTDFLLEEETFTVLITGPNTGGKTVALKNIGLMVLMAQSGLHLPAAEARLTVFDHVFADIGDEQSIEHSLSTFSAHIRNIIRILDQVDERSLVLLDELGSGTDPTEGAAIAQAIIRYLMDKGATSLIATHYPELKVYAGQTPGATNASMLFDVETLSPTYELAIGVPGKSNALAIARRLGLDESILDEAIKLVGVGSNQAETLIASIYDLRDKIAADEAAARLARRKAEQERDRLTRELEAAEAQRREVVVAARKQADQELAALRDELQRLRREMRDAASATALKKVSQQAAELAESGLQMAALQAAEETAAPTRRFKRLETGDTVFVRSLNSRGVITAVQGRVAEVAAGRLTLRVGLDDLEFRGRESEDAVPESSGVSKAPLTSTVGMELDLRGQRVEEGLEQLDQYLDSAMLSNAPWVRVIHGKGTGRLRQAVRDVLAAHPYVSGWEEGKDGEGGAGVTVARLKQS